MKFGTVSIAQALRPLENVPADGAWNLEELFDLLSHDVVQTEAAVLVGLIERRQGTQVLLTRRTDALRHHGGQVSFPGGRIERDDADAMAAALREADEEIGLPRESVTPLGYLDPIGTITGFRVLPLVAQIDIDFVPLPDPREVAEVFEMPLEYLMAPQNLERIEMNYRGRMRQVLTYRHRKGLPQQRIWGVTASILYNLRERLRETQ